MYRKRTTYEKFTVAYLAKQGGNQSHIGSCHTNASHCPRFLQKRSATVGQACRRRVGQTLRVQYGFLAGYGVFDGDVGSRVWRQRAYDAVSFVWRYGRKRRGCFLRKRQPCQDFCRKCACKCCQRRFRQIRSAGCACRPHGIAGKMRRTV